MRLDYYQALTNLSMMNLGKADAEQMSLYEYQARMYHWNKIHKRPDKDSDLPEQVPHEVSEQIIANIPPELLGPTPPDAKTEPAKMA